MRRRRFHPRTYAEIIARQNGICACCDVPLGTDPRLIEFDHILPIHLGGEDNAGNMRALTKSCHRAKTSREATQRAKTKRLSQGPRMNRHDRLLAKYLESEEQL